MGFSVVLVTAPGTFLPEGKKILKEESFMRENVEVVGGVKSVSTYMCLPKHTLRQKEEK